MDVRIPAPALAGFFRSSVQAAILGEVFCGAVALSISDLARVVGAAQPTVSRDVRLLEECGLVVTVPGSGRVKLVEPHPMLPFAAELRVVLAHTYGLLPLLQRALGGVAGIERVIIFGSWADRYHGELGRFPADIDLIVVGTIDTVTLAEQLYDVEEMLHIEINPIVFPAETWSPELRLVEGRHLVEVPL